MSTTYEEACVCPKCGKPGEVRQKTKSKDGHGKPCEVHLVYCTTELCKWFDTPWTIQVREDGSIPEAYSGVMTGPKAYPKLSQEMETKVRESIEFQLERETSRNPEEREIRNPHAP